MCESSILNLKRNRNFSFYKISKNFKKFFISVFYFECEKVVKYIDLQARVYKDWNDFLKTNVIDPSLCCYPINGNYAQKQETEEPTFDEDRQLELAVAESPSCSLVKTGIRWTQKALTYASYALMVASVATPYLAQFSKLKTFCNSIKSVQKYAQYANAIVAIAK